ncbi:hypothetical protein BGZ65_009486, partial [Modicella reniformis]
EHGQEHHQQQQEENNTHGSCGDKNQKVTRTMSNVTPDDKEEEDQGKEKEKEEDDDDDDDDDEANLASLDFLSSACSSTSETMFSDFSLSSDEDEPWILNASDEDYY